jgi:type IV fimbrial biogenesis protein FimT
MKNRDQLHIQVSKARGFTLVELMVTVAIVAILLSIGAPQLRNFLQRQQVNADVDSLTVAIQLARSEALKRSGRVSICPLSSPDAKTCVVAATSNWTNGWMVYIDYGAAGFQSDTDTILKVEQSVRAATITSSDVDTDIKFEANALSSLADASTFTIQSGDEQCKKLVISAQGRVTTTGC